MTSEGIFERQSPDLSNKGQYHIIGIGGQWWRIWLGAVRYLRLSFKGNTPMRRRLVVAVVAEGSGGVGVGVRW